MITASQLRSALTGLHVRMAQKSESEKTLLRHMGYCSRLLRQWRIERDMRMTTIAAASRIRPGTICRIEMISAPFSPNILGNVLEAAIRLTVSAGE